MMRKPCLVAALAVCLLVAMASVASAQADCTEGEPPCHVLLPPTPQCASAAAAVRFVRVLLQDPTIALIPKLSNC